MPHVLIAGCGYVGSVAAKLFADSGWDVTGWVRSDQVAGRGGEGKISLKAVDIANLEAVRSNAFAANVVVHCASSGADSYRHVYRDGITTLIFTHIFQNIGMTISVLPITGVPLPLISYSGSFVLMIMFGLGIVNSVWVNRRGDLR